MRMMSAKPLLAALGAAWLISCVTPPEPPTLEEKGRQLFFNETFGGNGRTCGTCHRAEDNFTITPAFIATLPQSDPLFVAETNPDLARGFEVPAQMRAHGLIRENLDGFEDLDNKFTLRGVPHTLAQRTSIASPDGPRTGWSGDGSPGDHTLRSFAVGAVVQHFPKTLNRVAGVDFRLPTEEELDALEAFMLSTGRQEELTLPLALSSAAAMRGQTLFLDNAVSRCNICHFNAGANGNPNVLGPNPGNRNFNTGVVNIPLGPGEPPRPRDDGFGIPGDDTFNTPPLVEAADTGPFFHNSAIATIEDAVRFYTTPAFGNSPAGQLGGGPVQLNETQVGEIAAFLRVINALENVRQVGVYLDEAVGQPKAAALATLRLAGEETDDAITVLEGASLNPEAVVDLRRVKELVSAPGYDWKRSIRRAREALGRAHGKLLT
jgi:hypothetical protein